MQYIQDITRLIYEYNLEIERFLTKNKSGSFGFTPPHYQWKQGRKLGSRIRIGRGSDAKICRK